MTRDPAGITAVIRDMEKEVDAISDQIIDIVYYMEGGTNFNEMWGASYLDRARITKSLTAKLKAKAGDKTEQM